MNGLVDDARYSDVAKNALVCDNLNTHSLASLNLPLAPREVLRLALKLDIVHTPKHGSWLSVAESELSAQTRQFLSERLPERRDAGRKATAWRDERSAKQRE